MGRFKRQELNNFLAIVRKYMAVRGGLSQKDLAEMTGTGVSTISRFLNQKTKELDSQLIANIVAKLNIPLHEVIDFVDESAELRFKKMVQFYKELELPDSYESVEYDGDLESQNQEEQPDEEVLEEQGTSKSDDFSDFLSGSARKSVTANVRMGGKTRTIPFEGGSQGETTVKDKLQSLTPRQKAYLSDFLNLDVESKDLVVDLGNSLFRYFRQKGMEF